MRNGLILTGCAGFIGINFLLKLMTRQTILHRYAKIILIDKLGYASQYNLETYTELTKSLNAESHNININELRPKTFTSMMDWDVINFASESHVDNSISTPNVIFTENATLVPNLLASFVDIKTIRSFIHISTDEIYGDLSLNTRPNNWFDTTSPVLPNNPYSASKAAQDMYLRGMKNTFKLPIKTIRLANQFGSYQHPEKMIPASCIRAFKGQSIKLYGTGDNKRQWTPVSISAEIICDVIEKNMEFDVLHIADKNGLRSNRELTSALIDIINDSGGTSAPVTVEYIEDRKGHDLMYAIKTNAFVDAYFDKNTFVNALLETSEYYFSNKKLFGI